MSKILKQQENVDQLMKLIKENPNLRIVPLVETECVPSDDHSWWVCEWGRASIEEIYLSDDRVYIRSEDEELLADKVYDEFEDDDLPYEESYVKAEEIVARYPWEKIIAVYVQI